MKIRLLVLLTISIIFSSGTFQQSNKITVAVAANAQYAMKALETQFEKETGKEVDLVIGSSGKLTAQIREGAPYDVFLSADMEFPTTLHKEGLTTAEPKVYGYGTLVLWTMKDIDLNIKSVLSPTVKNIAIANPKVAPYGEAAISVLKYHKLYDKVESKLVFGESISQVTQYVTTQSADIGFTAKSIVLSPEMQQKGKWIDLDKKSYQPIAQGAVILKSYAGRNKAGGEQFFNYVFSAKAKNIFKKYGYTFQK